VLLSGATGIGKTAIALALASDFDFELLEMNASDSRNSKAVERIAGLGSVSQTFSGKRRLLLIDEVDGLFGNEDRGGASAIASVLKEPGCPIILTADNVWDPKLAGIRQACERLELKTVNYLSIANLLSSIAKRESVSVDKEMLQRIARNCGGDIRSAINDLQLLAEGRDRIEPAELDVLGGRDREESMFEVVHTVLRTMDFHTSRDIVVAKDEEPDFIMKWIDENVSREYSEPRDLHKAYESLSRADIFLGRIFNRQHFGFMRYASDLMSAGVSLSKERPYSGFGRYNFPQLLSYLSRSRPERELRKQVCLKVGKLCHVSSAAAMQTYLPMLRELFRDQDKAARLTAQLELTEDEADFLGGTKAAFRRAGELREEYIRQKQVEVEKGQGSLGGW
jgi:replication factor C large subunit